MSEANIITGNYVRISQTPASVGERVTAQIIDVAIVVAYALGVTYILRNVLSDYATQTSLVLGIYLPGIGYSFLMETLNGGQSFGKMALHLQVVKADGTTPTVGDYLLRWMLRIIDVDFMAIGLMPILFTDRRQRFGDMAAGTMVIKLHDYHRMQVSLDEFSYADPIYRPVYPQAEQLSLNQIDVIQRTLDSNLGDERDRRLSILSEKTCHMLGITRNDTDTERFLYTLVRDYQHYALEMV